MRKLLKSKNWEKGITVLIFFFFILYANINYGQITTKGQDFINIKSGEKLLLKGFGIGCWLLPEGYMLGIRKIDRPWMFENAIVDLIGEEDADQFWDLYYENYLTEGDIAAMKSWGANSLRIALLAAVLQPRDNQPDTPPYNYSEKGFKLLDKLVGWCNKYNIGIIWDMHGAPGAQNAENISDSDGEARLWTEKEKYWPRCIELWHKIAQRYKEEECIIGYDLLNEPLLIRYENVPDAGLLRELYVQLTDTIRTVDSLGIIFIEGDDWAQTFEILEPMNWDPHLAMAFHSYPPTSNSEGLERWDNLRSKYNIPLWHGETGEQRPPYKLNIDATTFLESSNVGWNWWTHKKFDLQTQPWSIIRTPGFLNILEYWKGSGNRPSKEEARGWLFDQAILTHSDNCQFLPDMIKSLVPLNPDKYIEKKEVKVPEIVVEPENLSVEAGGVVQLSVKARGFPLNYRWFKNGHELPDQKDYQLYIANPKMVDNQSNYIVKISNSEGTVESKKIILDVIPFSGPTIQYTSISPLIDAQPDDIWDNVQPIALENKLNGKDNSKSDISGWIKLFWDNSNIYIWAQITDDVLSNKNNDKNRKDGLEIYLDINNSKQQSYNEFQYQLSLSRDENIVKVLNGELKEAISSKQKNIEDGYQMEFAIPWAAVNGKPANDKFIGIEVHIVDNDNDGRNVKLAWKGNRDLARYSPMFFGTMKLVKN